MSSHLRSEQESSHPICGLGKRHPTGTFVFVDEIGHLTCRRCRRIADSAEQTDKLCPRCNEIKPVSDFYFRNRSGTRFREITSWCKACTIDVTKTRYKRDPETFRADIRKRKYGITLEQYKEMLAAQDDTCAICHQPETRKFGNGETKPLSVDHDHATGRVRGLLCEGCNHGIGHLREDLVIMRAALEYVERHENQPDKDQT